jgi:polysaccharide export outer membrane protein
MGSVRMMVARDFLKRQKRRSRMAQLTCVTLIGALSQAGAADYKLNTGDVLELSAISVSDFRHRASVGPQGEIRLPLVGEINVRDKSVEEVLRIVQDRIPTKILRRRAQDGSGYDVVIDKDEITLVVVEYNPIYIKGDLAKPGSYPYRPGLTVRQALSLAGGYNVLQTRTDNSYLQSIELRSEQDALLSQLARDRVRVRYIEAELGFDGKVQDAAETPPQFRNIEALEVEQLNKSRADFDKERKHLTEAAGSLSANLAILEKQMRTEAERAKVDQDELERVESLVAKGMAPVTRLSDTRRLLLLSASRATEIEARTEQVRQRRAEEQRKLERLVDQRRIDLLKDLQDTRLRLADTQTKQSSGVEKMLYIGGLQAQMAGGTVVVPEISIFRKTQTGSTRLPATEDFELLPSDVLDVTLRMETNSPQQTGRQSPPSSMEQVEPELKRRLSEHLQTPRR